MMKMKSIIVATALVAGSATAQSPFEGVYGQIGVGYEQTKPTHDSGQVVVTGVGSFPLSATHSTSQGFTGVIGAGYMAPISSSFLLGLGVEYAPLTGSTASHTSSLNGAVIGTGSYQKQSMYNVFLSPATPIGKDGLLYGKVGYSGAAIKYTLDAASNTYNFTGYSLGIGYKQIISGGLYGFAEGNYFAYGNQTNTTSGSRGGFTVQSTATENATAYNLLVGLGYKF
jgi:hypothetical protein